MAINPEIRDQAYQFFIEEAPELLQALEVDLLTLKEDRNTAKIHNLMRAAHSLKGGAASVGLEAIGNLAHRLENIFKALYDETLEIDTVLESHLLLAYDCLHRPLSEQIVAGYFDSEQALTVADPIFAQIEERLGDAIAAADGYIPSSAELGVDMAVSIFEVDVAQALDHLATVIAHPQDYKVAGELRAQAEVFIGFAELLNQPGFGAIAETVRRALDIYPERALEITQLALADFQLARVAILAGERSQIGPSAALMAFADSTKAKAEPGNGKDSLTSSPSFTSNPKSPSQLLLTELIEDLGASVPLLEDIFSEAFAASEIDLSEPMRDRGTTTEAPAIYQVEELAEVTPSSIIPSPADTDASAFAEIIDVEFAETAKAIVSWQEVFDGEVSQSAERTTNQFDRLPLLGSQDKAPVATNLTVRVDSERLEQMNNLVGELTINRSGISLQNQQLQGAARELLNRFGRFRKMVNHLREISDRMLVAPERYRYGIKSEVASTPWKDVAQHQRGETQNQVAYNYIIDPSADFDSLELDTYGDMHSQLQGLLEEMVQLEEAVDDIALFSKQSDRKLEQQRQMLTHLRDELMWARMLPMSEVLNHFPRVLRDLSIKYHKPVNLKLSGTGVLVDKAILEKLFDPLLHLLRNAFDHGIESPEIRRQYEKPEQGQIEIRAYHKGSQTIIEVIDDGQGLNRERIGRRALEMGLLLPEQLSKTEDSRLFEFIFEPGFSTAERVSELSGRGMGLDVVRSHLQSFQGTIAVSSSPHKGTIFTLHLPLTLTIAKLLVCLVNSTTLALPSNSVEEIVVPKTNQIEQLGTQRFLHWGEQIVPAYRLADLLDYACPLPETSSSKALVAVPPPEDWEKPMLVMTQGQQFFALEVDCLVTEQELAIKPFGTALKPPGYIYGCTILGDGSVIPAIDGTVLLDSVVSQSAAITPLSASSEPQHAIAVWSPESVSEDVSAVNHNLPTFKIPTVIHTAQVPTVLVVDDAATLRRTLALSLERNGFRVLQAQDGREAIEQLQENLSVQLVVCDVEMPNMNGFDFLNHRRQDPKLLEIPVVMLTSRSNDKHRWLAMHLGATAYFTKPYIEQGFLKAIKDIVSC